MLLTWAAMMICSWPVCAQTLDARSGQAIMPNGYFAPGEWADASKVTVDGGLIFYAKYDKNYFYLGIKREGIVHTGLDLYIATDAENRRLFHVSSALAEAMYKKAKWSEWIWEDNRQWAANRIGLYQDEEGRRNSEPEGFEFQFSREMIQGDAIFIAVQLKRPEHIYPPKKDREAFKNWLKVKIKE
jgi:hypothetical protein